MRTPRTLLISALFFCATLAAGEVPVAVTTQGGSLLHGMLQSDRPISLRKNDGGTVPLELAAINSLLFGERTDPNSENEALVALNDLPSDKFEVRDAALAKLRRLGRAAIRPLRTALNSPDAEVAARARTLLEEMSVQNAADRVSDHVVGADGVAQAGEFTASEFTVRTRFGMLKFPVQTLVGIDFLKAGAVNADVLVPAGQAVIPVQAAEAEDSSKAAERWDPALESAQAAEAGGPVDRDLPALLGAQSLSMGRVPDPKFAGGKKQAPQIAAKAGDRLEDAYAKLGVLLRATNGASKVEAAEGEAVQLFCPSGGMAARAAKSDLELQFIVPGSYGTKDGGGRLGGVCALGAFVKSNGTGTVGVAVYDRAGRQLAQVLNRNDSNIAAGGVRMDEFIGVRSKLPIVRARFFRVDAGKVEDLIIDDIVFDRVMSAERDSGQSLVWLAGGERLVGTLLAGEGNATAPLEAIRLRPEFVGPKGPAVAIAMTELERYEPAQIVPDDGKPRRWMSTPHGVLLQNGETFRARLAKLDEKDVVFGLPGGVELTLPRKLLRKIDLEPEPAAPGEVAPPTAVAADEKPGVDFRSKKKHVDEGKPPEEKKPEDKKPNPAQGLSRMDDVTIVAIDPARGDLTVRDDAGDFDIGYALARTLVFPADPEADKVHPRLREWILVLREGSRFEISISQISPAGISGDMAGGAVTLPSHVVEAVQRQKQKK